MNKKLYNLMDWAAIEELVYGECDHPMDNLGAHTIGKQTLVQAFFPNAKSVMLYIDGVEGNKGKTVREEIKMDKADDAGFFAALLPGKDRKDYRYYVVYSDKSTKLVNDPYTHGILLTKEQIESHMFGTATNAYEFMGCHRITVDGVRGCVFHVWAPNAIRCSVVGDFNLWNSMEHQMTRVEDSGIFEVFIPGVEEGAKYKYDILVRGAVTFQKADPYSLEQELRPDCASIVSSYKQCHWQDEEWMQQRKKANYSNQPMNIWEMSLTSYGEGTGLCNIRKIAKEVATYVKKMGYTHVALMPMMEYPEDESAGYQTALYYAPSSRFGDVGDYMQFINIMHQEKIGVILQWIPTAFSNYAYGLGSFDGTCLYEHEDYRKGIDPRNGMLLFNYKRPEVTSYLLSNLRFWVKEFHIDGIMVDDVASMLYLDYYRKPGEWIPNIYGGNENLDSIEFLKEVNALIHKQKDGVITLADEESGWPNTTGTKEEGLGFDFTYNHGWNHDVIGYIEHDPIERHAHHQELTLSTVYQYSEQFILPISHHNVNYRQGGLFCRMPGNTKDKYSNLKAFYGYMMMHPGKKLLFMGQENAKAQSFDGITKLVPDILEQDTKQFNEYCKQLNQFYLMHPACYELDYDSEGFEWINNISTNENIISFMRKTKNDKDSLLIVINYANTFYEKYKIGVPQNGRYKEIFNSDMTCFGGEGNENSRAIPAKDEECDTREYSIRINLAPLSMSVFEWIPYTEKELKEMEERKLQKEQKRLEAERKKKQLAEEKAKIRASLKEELARKIADAEAQIAKGSERKGTKKK